MVGREGVGGRPAAAVVLLLPLLPLVIALVIALVPPLVPPAIRRHPAVPKLVAASFVVTPLVGPLVVVAVARRRPRVARRLHPFATAGFESHKWRLGHRRGQLGL